MIPTRDVFAESSPDSNWRSRHEESENHPPGHMPMNNIARRNKTIRYLALAGALLTSVQAGSAQAQPATWTQVRMLTCRLNPSIGFVIFGHQSMECRFVQNPPLPTQAYEGALNTVGLDLGVTAGGVLGWAVLAPTAGPPPGALAGEYVGASGEVGMGLGAGVNVLLGGSGRSFALQPASVAAFAAIQR